MSDAAFKRRIIAQAILLAAMLIFAGIGIAAVFEGCPHVK